VIGRALRLFHTLRHLRPVQFWSRACLMLRRPRIKRRVAPARRPSTGAWINPARAPSMTGPARFLFLSEEHELRTATDWDNSAWPRLWRYNLHYFDDLVADGASDRAAWHRGLVERWVAENPPARGNGWDPYPTSLRIVNWVKWTLAGNALPHVALASLADQARWLRRRLEFHLLGNHLWANAKALVFAGSYFRGEEALSWLRTGLRLLRREIREQILPDGGHVERSPMYHTLVLADILDLIQLAQRVPDVLPEVDVIRWQTLVPSLFHWLDAMTFPDGEISFFNDAAFGIAPRCTQLRDYAAAIGCTPGALRGGDLRRLEESGYVRMETPDAVVIADVGQVGPDYQPGHAHADTLGFELAVKGRRVLVNGGTSTYETSPERLRQRGTAAHNTVCVEGEDSSEVWSAFRVARRARPFDVSAGHDSDGIWLEASHDGYRRLPGRVLHERRWSLRPGRLEIIDTLSGRFAFAEAFLHVHPDFRAVSDKSRVVLSLDKGMQLEIRAPDSNIRIEPGNWHPRFGVTLPAVTLRVPVAGTSNRIVISWH
jgi:uncharacterized heparinase superfamily protein